MVVGYRAYPSNPQHGVGQLSAERHEHSGENRRLKGITLCSMILILSLPAPSLCGESKLHIGYVTMDSAVTHAQFAAAFRDGLRNNGYIEVRTAS